MEKSKTELEKEIIIATRQSVSKAILEQLSGYSSPLRPYIDEVVKEQADELRKQLRKILSGVLTDPQFAKILKEEFRHKVAKNLVGELTGSIDKAVNLFRQDPTLRAKLVTAIEEFIDKHNQ
jgi:hypothetical protein